MPFISEKCHPSFDDTCLASCFKLSARALSYKLCNDNVHCLMLTKRDFIDI